MAQRYELNDRQWATIEPLLPKQGRGGAWKDHRTILNGISWRLDTGAPWQDLPERYGPWQTVYDRFVEIETQPAKGYWDTDSVVSVRARSSVRTLASVSTPGNRRTL